MADKEGKLNLYLEQRGEAVNAVTAIVVSYNSLQDLPSCLESLRDQPDLTNIIVVDNASSDGSAQWVIETWPEVLVLRTDTNLGFAKACNLGARKAQTPWLLFFNPDATAAPEMVFGLLDFAHRHPECGLYGGVLRDEHGHIDPKSCWAFPNLWSSVCFALGLSTLFNKSSILNPESLNGFLRDTERVVGVVSGCLLLCSIRTWKSLGGFDETYFLYGEDADLSERARRLGYRPAVTPLAQAEHRWGKSSSSALTKSLLLFSGKATVLRQHRPRTGPICVHLLVVGIAWRTLLSVMLRRSTTYGYLWSTRRTWRQGFAKSATSLGDSAVQ